MSDIQKENQIVIETTKGNEDKIDETKNNEIKIDEAKSNEDKIDEDKIDEITPIPKTSVSFAEPEVSRVKSITPDDSSTSVDEKKHSHKTIKKEEPETTIVKEKGADIIESDTHSDYIGPIPTHTAYLTAGYFALSGILYMFSS